MLSENSAVSPEGDSNGIEMTTESGTWTSTLPV